MILTAWTQFYLNLFISCEQISLCLKSSNCLFSWDKRTTYQRQCRRLHSPVSLCATVQCHYNNDAFMNSQVRTSCCYMVGKSQTRTHEMIQTCTPLFLALWLALSHCNYAPIPRCFLRGIWRSVSDSFSTTALELSIHPARFSKHIHSSSNHHSPSQSLLWCP